MNDLVALELKLEATRQRVTNTALAKSLGLSRNYVGNLLNGKADLTLRLVESIAFVLGVDPSRVVEHALSSEALSKLTTKSVRG